MRTELTACRESECPQGRGSCAHRERQEDGSEHLGEPGLWEASHKSGTTRSAKARRGHVASPDHTASQRQSEKSTLDQLGPGPVVSYSSVSQTLMWMRFHWRSC